VSCVLINDLRVIFQRYAHLVLSGWMGITGGGGHVPCRPARGGREQDAAGPTARHKNDAPNGPPAALLTPVASMMR